jgi:hypothetical protein
MVANGYFVGVSTQIFHHRFWASKRLFGKNYPTVFPIDSCRIFSYFWRFCFQFLTKFSPENLTQGLYRKQKFTIGSDVFPLLRFHPRPTQEQCSAGADEDSNSVPKCAKQQSFPFAFLFLPNV